jgi:formylglycine-generating enzyme required for sulfatase activity
VAPFRDPLTAGGEGPLMVALPAGRFLMGSGLLGEAQDEGPVREVVLRAFALSAHEVTRAEWNRFAQNRGLPAQGGAPELPASGVSWEAALAYARWLATASGQPYRLPTEAEWEYAARAGSPGLYGWGNTPGSGKAWCVACSPDLDPVGPTRVGQFDANGFGLFDTAGNVAEWVQDCYRPGYEGAPTDGSAVEDAACTRRVHRGGGWSSPSRHLRITRRAHAPPTATDPAVGIRVARDLPTP